MRRFGAFVTGVGMLAVLVVVGAVLFAKLEYVRPGYVGVSVRKCGGGPGGAVRPEPIPSGYYWRELFCEEIVEYPVSLQTLILTRSPHEGSTTDDSITVTSSEGLPINTDVSVSFTLDPPRVPAIYVKFRNDLEHIKQMFIRQTVREGLQEVFARYAAEQLYSTKRQEARVEVQKFLAERLSAEGFSVQQFTINETRVPDQVVAAINAKVAMMQEALKAEQQVRKTRAEADQAVAQAEGQARSKRALADAEAYYNTTVARSLTPGFVNYKALEKWDGKLPQIVGSQSMPFINVKPPEK